MNECGIYKILKKITIVFKNIVQAIKPMGKKSFKQPILVCHINPLTSFQDYLDLFQHVVLTFYTMFQQMLSSSWFQKAPSMSVLTFFFGDETFGLVSFHYSLQFFKINSSDF